MRLPAQPKWLLPLLTAAAILAAVAASDGLPGGDGAELAAPPPAVGGEIGAARGPDELDLARLHRATPDSGAAANAFKSTSWYVPPPPPPPPPPVKPLPPPAPAAPPLPFTYLGRYQDEGKPVIFLVRGNRVLSVTEGDVIEGRYRVGGINGAMLDITYLPLDIRQSINVGEVR